MIIYLRVLKESFAFALNALRTNKLRTFLSLLGVTIGIFSIIAVLAAVDSLERNIKEGLSGLDANTMYLTKFSFGPTEVPRWQRDNFPQTDYRDFDFVRRNVPNLGAVAYAILGGNESVRYGGETLTNVGVTAISSGIYEIEDLKIANGRFYTEAESETGASVIVLGHSIATNLFKNTDPIGKEVRVYGRKLQVIGVLKKYGAGLFDTPDEKAYVPVNFVRQFKSGGAAGLPGAIILKPAKDVDLNAFEASLVQNFRIFRGLKPDEPNNFFINKISGFATLIDGIIATMNFVGWLISGFSLLVGGFGIANIMFVSVKERTNIIGIQKSLGAKNKFILLQFLFEAVILALVGGLVGLGLVWIATLIVSQFTGEFQFVLSFWNMFVGFTLSSIIGLIAGIIPAISASKLDPVEAIRTGM